MATNNPTSNQNIFNINPKDPSLYKFLSTPASVTQFAPSKHDAGFLPGGDLEEYRSQRQSWQDKLGNGLAKFTSSAFTGALESTVGAVYGATSALVNRDASKFWDNEFSRSLDGITEGVNENFPHYYSEAEKNATTLGSMAYGNFWFDKALGSAGYTVGSLIVGLGASKVFQLGKAARLAQLGEEAIVAEGAATQAAGGLGRAAAKKTAWDVSKELGLGMMMAHGESAMEGRQTADQTKQFYEDARRKANGDPQNGIPPDPKFAQYASMSDDTIKQLSTDAGNSNYLMNLAITGGTNMMLLGKFLPGKKAAIKEYNAIGQRTAKAAANEAVEGVEKVAVEGATEYFDKIASKKFGALLNPIRAFGSGFITEGGQEGLQYASNIASQEFVKNRAIDKQGWWSSMLEGMGEGLSKALTDKEGLESILLGGVTGGPFGIAGARGERLVREENTRQLVDFMNNDPNFKNANEKVSAFLSSTKQINEAEDFLKQGDHFNAKNKSDQALNTYLKSVIDNGGQDYFITRLESLKSVGDEALAEHFGEGTTAEDVDKVIDKLGTLEKLNDDLITLYGISGGTKEQQIYNGQLRDRLFFSASTIKDEEKRIADIQNELQGMGNSKIDNLLQLRQAALTIADTVESYPVDKTKTSEEQKKEQEKYLAEIKENAYDAYNKAVTKFGEEASIDGAQALTLLSDLNGLTERKANFIEYYNALNDPDKAVKLKAQEDGYLQANEELNNLTAEEITKREALAKTTLSSANKAIKVNSNRESRITYKDVDTNIAKYDQNTLEELAQDIEEDLIDATEAEDFETRAKLVEARNKVITELEFRKDTQAKVDTLVDKLANATPDQVDNIVKEIKDAGFDVDAEYIEKLKDSLKEAVKAREAFENRKAEINKNFKGANEFFHSFTEKNAAQKENLREALGRSNPTKLLHFVARTEPNAGAIVPVGDNPKIRKRVPEVVLEVWSGGIDETTGEVFKDIQVGVMPYYGQYLYPDGTPIDIQNLNEKEYAELFGPDSTDPAKYSLDSFKAAQRKMQSLYTEVKGILGDKSSEKIFPGKVKSLGTFSLTGGTYNITNDDTPLAKYLEPDVVNKPYMRNGAPVILSISSYDGTTGTFPNKTIPITSSTSIAGILDNDGNNVLHNAMGENDDTLLPALNTLKQRITQPKTGEGIWNKYWMLVEDSAGTITIEGSNKTYDWRPVTPNLLQEEERTNLFNELLDLAKQAIEEKDKPLDSAQKEINKARTIAANEGLFIALSTGTVDKQYKNATLSFGTSPKGLSCSLDLELNTPLNDNGVKVYKGKIYFDIPSTVTTVEEFITFFNDAIKRQQVLKYQGKIAGGKIQGQVAYSINNNIQPLTLKSFRKNFRGEGEKKSISNITPENVWDSFYTNVSVVEPRKDQKIKFVPKSEASSVVIPTPGKTVVASTTMLDTIGEINKYFNELVISKTAGLDGTFKFYIKNAFILPQDVTDNKDFLEQEVNSEQEAIDIVTRFIDSTKVAKSSDAKTDALTAHQNLLIAAQKTDDTIALLQTPAFESMIDADEFDAFAQELSNDPAIAQEMQTIAGLTATTEEEFNKVIGQFILTRFLNKKIEELTNKVATNLSSNEALENVTPEEFEEVLRLSEFYLDNPSEPGVVGNARSRFPNLFKAVTERLFNIKQLEGDLNNKIQVLVDNGVPIEEARAIAQKEFTESEGGKNVTELTKHYNDLDNIGQQVAKQTTAKTAQSTSAAQPATPSRRRTGGNAGEAGKAGKTGFYSEEDTIKLDAAIQNLSKILPSWIKVEELQQLASSLRQGKITFGSFYKNVIKLSKYAKAGTEFHEAFHAIFRTLLTDEQQDALYAEAKDLLRQELKKQGKTYNEGFTEFKKERPDYAHLSDEILKDLYVEEWMADEFAKYTQGKSVIKPKAKATSFVGKMLEKFFDLIKRIGKLFNDKPTLQNLFADIETGKFRNDKQRIKNRFSTNSKLNEEAHSAIYVGDSEDGLHKRFLNGDIRLRLENTVASNVLSNMRAGSTQDPLTIINEELAKLGQRFNLDDPMYDTLFNDVRYSAQAELIQDLDYLFNSSEDLAINSREQFIEGVKTKLKEFNVKEFESSADESIDGDQNITERSFDLNNENKGGFSSLSKFLRKYIGTTVYTTSLDEFLGLPKGTVFEGQEITIAVNPKKVYDGLVKICANQANPGDVLRKMWYASKENTEGAKFLYKFFEDAGISYDETNQLEYNPDKYDLVQQVTKGFNLFSVDYIFTHVDSLNKDSKTYRANRKDMDYIQLQNWKDNFANLFKTLGSEKLKDNANNIKGLQLITRNSANTYEADKIDLDKTIEDLQKSLASIGVNLSKMFLRYALLANPNRTKTAEQIDFVQQFEGQVKLNYQQIYDNLNTIRQLVSEGADPFTRQEKIGKEEDSVTKSMKIALDNAVFDENVFVTSMVNADNKNIYPYQQPNYHVQKIKELNTLDFNDPKVIEAIHSEKPNQDYLENNYLLNNPVFKYMLKNLAIERIDGIKQAELEKGEDGEKKLKRSNKDREGVTYGSMTDREVWTQMYSLFSDSSTDEVIPEQKADGKVLKVSHSVRRMIFNIMEASNTADVLKMSVRTLFSNGEVNKTFIDAQVAEVERELQRIERVKKGVYTDKYNKFNAYTPQGKERGKKFWESAQLLESIPYTNAAGIQTTLKDALETGAVTLEEAKPVLEKGIKSYFAAHLIEHEKELKRLGILSEKGENRLLHGKFEGGPKAEGDAMFGGSLRNNLFNAYLNMYLNNTAINQILMGDPALTLKDSTDWFKRARGNNASGPNLVSFAGDNTDLRVATFGRLTETGELDDFINDSYVKPKERIIKIGSPEWEEFSKDLSADEKQAILDSKIQEIKVGDAQCYTVTTGFTKFMKGLGKLTARGKELYKRIEQGGTINKEDWKYLVDNNLMMNSLKLVYYDGTTYIKMSVVNLTKDLTTDSDGFPRPGYDFLHDMRLEMEMNNVDMMGQPSMMKKMIKNPIALSNNQRLSITEENVNKLSLGYLRLQQENPSNKVYIKDPTQMQQIIAAEQNPETDVILPDGTPTTVGEILKRYDKGLVERVREQYKSAREFMFPLENGKRVINMKRATKVFRKLLEETGASQQLLDYLETDDQGNPIENLNAPSIVTAFEQHFNAYFNKVLSQKIPGYKVTLQSQFGMSPILYELATGKIITRYEYNLNPSRYRDSSKYGTRKLAFDQPRMVNGKETHRYSEILLPYHFAEQFGLKPGDAIPEELAYMFGVRIPSQDKHSALVLKVVDVLPPYYGSNMVGPDELILLTGSDFDIDSFYIHRMDHYVREGKLVPYGNSLDSKWSQYKRWNKDNNIFLKDLIDELSEDDQVLQDTSDEVKRLRKKLSQIEAIEASVRDGDYSDMPAAQRELLADKPAVDLLRKSKEKELDAYENALLELALRELKLPYNEELFNKSGIRNIGEINNEILTAKMILHSNSSMSDINKTPATLEAIENVLEQLAKALGYAKWQDLEKTYNPNTPLGMVKAFTTNKAGQAAIGAATNNTINYSILSRFGIKARTGDDVRPIRFTFKDAQGKEVEIKIGDIITTDLTTEDGMRIMDILSTLTSSMTDNTKYGYNSKMNIDINTLSVASLLSMNKVPILKIGYMLKSEYIVKLAEESRSYAIQTESEAKYQEKADIRLMNQLIDKLKAISPGMSPEDIKKIGNSPITDADLTLAMEYSPANVRFANMTQEEREAEMDEVTKVNYYMAQLKFVSSYSALSKHSTELIAFSQIVKLTKGISSSTKETSFKGDEDLQTYLKVLNLKLVDTPTGWKVEAGNAKAEDLPLYDFTEVINNHLITLENLNVFADKNELQEGYFVSQTKFAKNIREKISKALRTRMKNKLRTKAMTSLRRNLESFLMVKAWRNSLTAEEKENLNTYLYVDAARKAGMPTLEELKKEILDAHPELSNNMIFTQVFFRTEGNKMVVQYNTRTKGNKGFEGVLLDEMRRLQNSPAFPLVKALSRHLLVKDALQFKNNSPISLLPPATLRALYQFSGFIDEYTPDLNSLNDDRFKTVFGSTIKEISDEFEEFFLRDIDNGTYLNWVNAKELQSKDTEKTKTPLKINEDKSFSLDLDAGVQNIKEDTEISNEQGEVIDIIDNTNEKDVTQRKRNFAVFKSFNFISVKKEYTKRTTDKATKLVSVETKKANVFKFPKIIKIGNTLYKIASYVPVESRYKEENRVSTIPNEDGDFIGTQVTYKPTDRFIGPYGKSLEENEEYSYEKVKAASDAAKLQSAEDEAADDAEDYPESVDTKMVTNAPDITSITTTPTSTPTSSTNTTTPTTKIISGFQTGVDNIGLEVAKDLGYETGGTAPRGFFQETTNANPQTAKYYNVTEITPEAQTDYTKRTGKTDSYTARTEQNVINSDGTVYFNYSDDSKGLQATKREADKLGKPFLANPTAEELKAWLAANNIKTLNVAGNRGSKLTTEQAAEVREVLTGALGKNVTPLTKTEQLVQKNIAMQTKTALSTDEAVTGSRTLLVAQILGMSREKMQQTLLAVVNAFASGKIKNLPNIVMQISKTNAIMNAAGMSKDGRLIDQVVRDVVEKASDEEVLELHKTMCKI